jgi:hypothetical protein
LNCKNILLLTILFLLVADKSIGQFIFDPYRYGFARYLNIESFKNKERFHDNYLDMHSSIDSIKVEMADTTFYVYQKKYHRTVKDKGILLFYFQRRKFSNPNYLKGITIENCRIIEVKESQIHCLCKVTDRTKKRDMVNRREIVFDSGQLDGIILGIGRTPRIMLITASVINIILYKFEFKED